MTTAEFKRIIDIWGTGDDLGNLIHSRLIYRSGKREQEGHLVTIRSIIASYSDEKLQGLGHDKKTRKAIAKLITARTKKNRELWMHITLRVMKGLKTLLEREIRKGKPVTDPGLEKRFVHAIQQHPAFDKDSTIKVTRRVQSIIIHYISLEKSPDHDKAFKSWRDTEFKFAVYLDKGLGVWLYLNVHKDLRGRGIGTRMVKAVESIARKNGIRRFSVEYPTRKYWRRHQGYAIPRNYCIGKEGHGYSFEGYKEYSFEGYKEYSLEGYKEL